jgi:hypothetical protein
MPLYKTYQMDDTKYLESQHVLIKRHHNIDSLGTKGSLARQAGDKYFCPRGVLGPHIREHRGRED